MFGPTARETPFHPSVSFETCVEQEVVMVVGGGRDGLRFLELKWLNTATPLPAPLCAGWRWPAFSLRVHWVLEVLTIYRGSKTTKGGPAEKFTRTASKALGLSMYLFRHFTSILQRT